MPGQLCDALPVCGSAARRNLPAADLQRQGWWLSCAEELTVHHQASARRDSTARPIQGRHNTLGFTWLRRPLLAAPAAQGRPDGTAEPPALVTGGQYVG